MKLWKWILLGLAILILWWLRDAVSVLFALLLLSITIAYLASPLARVLERRLSKKWGALLAFTVFLLAVIGCLAYFVPMMIRQAVSVGEALPGLWEKAAGIMESLQAQLMELGLSDDLMKSVGEQAALIGGSLIERLRDGVMGIVQWLGSIGWVILSPVVAYYLLRDREQVFSQIERTISSAIRPLIVSIAAASREAIGQYVRGQVLVSIITGILTAAGLLFVGLPSWLLMGFFMAVLNLIPYFGPVLGAIPILLLSTAQGWGMIVKCLVVVVLAQQIESLLISPRILSSAADLHPVIVVIATFLGGSVGGLAGMVFVIPCVLIMRVVFKQLIDYRLKISAEKP